MAKNLGHVKKALFWIKKKKKNIGYLTFRQI